MEYGFWETSGTYPAKIDLSNPPPRPPIECDEVLLYTLKNNLLKYIAQDHFSFIDSFPRLGALWLMIDWDPAMPFSPTGNKYLCV